MFGFVPIPSRWARRDEGAVCNATICDGRRNEKKWRSPSSPVGPAPSLLQVSRDGRGAIFDLPKSPSVSLTPGKAAFYVTPSKPVPGHALIAKRVILLTRPHSISPLQPGRGRSSPWEPLPAGRGEALAKLPSLSARLYLLLIYYSCQDKLFLSSSQEGCWSCVGTSCAATQWQRAGGFLALPADFQPLRGKERLCACFFNQVHLLLIA